MLKYFNLFLQTLWFFKTNNCPFCNKTTQDFAEFWEISGKLKGQNKNGRWRNFEKKKMVIFMIFAPLYYLSRVKGYSQLLLCEAPKCNGLFHPKYDIPFMFFIRGVVYYLKRSITLNIKLVFHHYLLIVAFLSFNVLF